jgi:multidrug transporter EmrE-like cation transporter
MSIINASLIIVGLSLVGVLGDYFIKLSGNNAERYVDLKWFIVGLIVYSSTAIGWFFVMKHIKLSTLGVIYGVTTVVALTAVGIFFFKEHLNTYEIIGIIAGVSSIILLSRFG